MFDFSKIEGFIDRCNRATDDAELRRVFQTYNVQFDLNIPPDPFSEQYNQRQMDIYEQLAGKSYSPTNEVTNFDVETAARSPFPYANGSCELVGNHLMAIGYLIKTLSLPMGSKVLELGPGWGNLTLALAKTGLNVTAIDVENRFCRLISERAKREGLSIDVINADFNCLQSINSQFDAIIFFESFHHSAHHRSLMASFDRAIKPGGVVCFASEPIIQDFPIPWGLRMDGESVWAIRRNGWFELGFNESYFEEAMRRAGWYLTWNRSQDCPSASVALARRVTEAGGSFGTHSGRLGTQIGKRNDKGAFEANGECGFLVFGPYIDLPQGKYRAIFSIDTTSPVNGSVDLDVSVNSGTEILATRRIDSIESKTGGLEIDFALTHRKKGVEVRMFCAAGARITVTELKIHAV